MVPTVEDLCKIFYRDQRTIRVREMRSSRGCHLCEAKDPVVAESFSISRLPVAFFRISNFGMDSVLRGVVPGSYSSLARTSRIRGSSSCSCNSSTRCLGRSSCRQIRIRTESVIQRLVQVFTVVVCFLTIVRAPTAMSAPTPCGARPSDGLEESVPKWKNPCGPELETAADVLVSGGGPIPESDTDIGPILIAARVAQDHMNNFKESYVRETFIASYNAHLSRFRNNGLEVWVPSRESVPKSLGDGVDSEHLKTQTLDKFLVDIYESMQKYAVGIEQVVWDQQKLNGSFTRQFVETESNLRKVLCELRTAMYNRNIKPRNTVERCIMDEETRRIEQTAGRNLRDWIIFRECMNGLEYLIQVLEFLRPSPGT